MKHFGLIGTPLGHSASADYFGAKFASEGICAEYSLYEIADIADVESLRGTLVGMNVTIPYKKAIIPYLASISEEAKAVGAVNCVRIDSAGRMHGYNTDVEGIRATLSPYAEQLRGEQALVLGSGGASAAVAYVLREMGVQSQTVSRTIGRGDLTYEQLDESKISSVRLIVNTTPVGMFPAVTDSPNIPYQYLSSRHLLFDVVYNPRETEFLRRGAKQGALVVGGYEMFCRQAEASWRIWND